jgi:hypothetical protein
MSPLADADRTRLRDAVHGTLVAEFASARDDRPTTYPLTPLYDERRGTVVVTSPPAFARKVDAVRANPRVSLLVPGDDPVLVTGEATVHDDDLSANGWYMQGLALSEPASPKVDRYATGEQQLRTWLGRTLFDWYGLRIVVEIDPVAVTSVRSQPPAATVHEWEAIGMKPREARTYHRAVVTVVDADGYPVTWPLATVDPGADGGTGTDDVRLDVPPDVPVSDGRPACLLVHRYSPDLQSLGQRLVRGRCRIHGEEVSFAPASSSGWRNETVLDTLRMVYRGKRRTRRYFGETSPLTWTWRLEDGTPRTRPPWQADEASPGDSNC